MTLKPLPPSDDEILCKTSAMPVSAYGTVRIGHSTYSVPDEAIKQSVRVVVGAYEVKIYALDVNSRLKPTVIALQSAKPWIMPLRQHR
jgi:hypothetical protein